ncbi:MAG: 4Fe-4S dicluster domain-containing protein [Thermodesulfobacteriota bacterium]
MLKKLFGGLTTPRIQYIPLEGRLPEPINIPLPPQVTLILDGAADGKNAILPKIGDAVKTGQKLTLVAGGDAYAISPATGTISGVAPFRGEAGQVGTAITINTSKAEDPDDQFAAAAQEPTLDSAAGFLAGVPGCPPLKLFGDPDKPIHTIVINGADRDLLVATHQCVVQSRIDAIAHGIAVLKKITGIEAVIMVVPVNIMGGYGSIGAEVKFIAPTYPSALPHMILKDVLGKVIPAGKAAEDLGVAMINAEAVASIGRAYETGKIPFQKLLTVIKKDGGKVLVSARIGTPIKEIVKTVGETVNEMDRVILGGPMMGVSIFTLDTPVRPDTDALMIQDKAGIPFVSDYPCINCGECIRICPARIPVNMLVRFLEAGQYQEAADLYDLYSCFECGLCSYVCVSRMPIFQYIRLAKFELGRIETAEVTNV